MNFQIKLLMSRVIQPTTINIFYDQPVVHGSERLYEKFVSNLSRSNNCKVEFLKLGELVIFFKALNNMMNEDP